MVKEVYFIRRADGIGPVKIGCSRDPGARLRGLMTWSPYPLAVTARLIGDYELERRFHALFRAQHSHHEWFRPSAALNRVIADICAGRFDTASLPAPQRLARQLQSVSPIRREALRQRTRLRVVTSAIGLVAPQAVQAAAERLEHPDQTVRTEAIQIIDDYRRDPLRMAQGRLPYPWALKKLTEYLERRGREVPSHLLNLRTEAA